MTFKFMGPGASELGNVHCHCRTLIWKVRVPMLELWPAYASYSTLKQQYLEASLCSDPPYTQYSISRPALSWISMAVVATRLYVLTAAGEGQDTYVSQTIAVSRLYVSIDGSTYTLV